MFLKRCLQVVFLFVCLASSLAFGQHVGGITLRDLDGKVVKLSSFDKKLRIIVFLSPECPLSQNYSLVLNQIQEQNKETTDVIGIFPGTSYLPKDYQAFKEKYKITFPLLTDSAKKLVVKLDAKVTPEVFLLDVNDKVIYSGAIDNWVIDLGKKRSKATAYYLSDAITSYIQSKPVDLVSTKAVGCYITDL
ncbi:redoxin domain-containing protein [Dyadobacter psychrotolerans]|uniref:Redoxin domain-containing protein n=1 Tax=Dyadobacter psychrotolerans TaxID=2541721 RepID=A0A4R5DNF3_9BACT|nr:redoxin domain-containing protein [Dyadobacter psychrotolerans]TDE13620.1 redoxin domain-containing protein [Dyadobacter psychrotolerans]